MLDVDRDRDRAEEHYLREDILHKCVQQQQKGNGSRGPCEFVGEGHGNEVRKKAECREGDSQPAAKKYLPVIFAAVYVDAALRVEYYRQRRRDDRRQGEKISHPAGRNIFPDLHHLLSYSLKVSTDVEER